MARLLATKSFWADAAERALSTAGQAFLAAFGTSAVLTHVNWVVVGSTTLVAAGLSVVKALVVAANTDASQPATAPAAVPAVESTPATLAVPAVDPTR